MKLLQWLKSGITMGALMLGGCRSDAPPVFRDAPTATAALRSVLAGYSIPFDPAELTEQCKVDDSGASVDDIEAVANHYGLDAEQWLVPEQELCAGDTFPLPAIVITERDGGDKEFVNVWRRKGDQLQIMDPWAGVAWIDCAEFQRRVYVHEMDVAGTTHRGLVAVFIFGRAT